MRKNQVLCNAVRTLRSTPSATLVAISSTKIGRLYQVAREICKCIHQRLSAELCKAYLTQLDHDSDLAHTVEYSQERKRRWKRSASIRLAQDWCMELNISIYIRLFNPGAQHLPFDRRGGGPMNVYCGPHGVRDGFCLIIEMTTAIST